MTLPGTSSQLSMCASRLALLCVMSLAMTSCRSSSSPIDTSSLELQGRPPEQASHTSSPSALAKREGALWYRIVPGDDTISITLRLIKPPRQLNLFLPGPWAGHDDWASKISIGQATTPEGARPITLQRHIGRLDIDAGEQRPWLELTYEVSLSERHHPLERFSPQKLDAPGGFFAYAPTLFILPSERLANAMVQIPVEIITPRDTTLITTWSTAHHAPSTQNTMLDVHGFIVPDVRALRDAFLLSTRDVFVEHHNDTLAIAYDTRFTGETSTFSAFIAHTLDTYHERFGEASLHTTALVRTPTGYTTSAQRWGTGRRGGFVLELEPDATLDQSARQLIAHEAFHLWNGHLLVPDAQTEHTTRWFKEGLTHYVALKTLHTTGELSDRELLKEIATAASRYNEAYITHSRKSQRDALPLYAYDKGMLLAAELDRMLATHSSGRVALNQWLAKLFERAKSQPDWRYTPEDLVDSLKGELPEDALDFTAWRRHCEGTRRIKLDTFFARMGLHWLDAEAGRAPKLIPLEHDDKDSSSWHMIPTSPRP